MITTPPQNLDAEEAVIGAILLDPAAIGSVADILKPEAFRFNPHRIIFSTALLLHQQGQPVDITRVASWLDDTSKLSTIGGRNRLLELVEGCITAANVRQIAQLVADKYHRRELIRICQSTIEQACDAELSLPEILNTTTGSIDAISSQSSPGGLDHLGQAVDPAVQRIRDTAEGRIPPGVPTGFYDIDQMTQGLQRTDLIIVAARPSIGKTSLALNIAANVAANVGPVALFSLETSAQQLTYRLLSMEGHLGASAMRSGRLTPDQWQTLTTTAVAVSALPIFANDQSIGSPAEMKAQCERLAHDVGPLAFVVIDYLQLMSDGSGRSGGKGSDNRNLELSRITRALKGLAKDLSVPVMALSQLSRGVEARTNKRPMLSDLRDSGSIEQDADLVAMLYRDEYYNPETMDKGLAEVIVAKHRNGPVGTVKLLFEPQFTRFRSMAASF